MPEYLHYKKEKSTHSMYMVHPISFQTFFRKGTFIDSTHMKL